MSIRSRRQFLTVAACATAEACVVGCGGKTPTIEGQRHKSSVRIERAAFDAARGRRRRGVWVEAGGFQMPLILIQEDDGTLHAVTSECTHEHCVVRPTKAYLACTCHAASYTFEGRVIDGPAREDLERFAVEDHGDYIDILL